MLGATQEGYLLNKRKRMPRKRLPKRVLTIMEKHRQAPAFMPQREVMKRLKLGNDYQKFYRLFYRAYVQQLDTE